METIEEQSKCEALRIRIDTLELSLSYHMACKNFFYLIKMLALQSIPQQQNQIGYFSFSFAGMEGEMYTIVGRLRKGKIIPYTKNRRAKVLLVYPGELSLEEVFKREHHAQRLTTWGFRFMGWVLIFFGATCTASLLHAIIMKIYFFASFAPDPNYPVPMNFIVSLSMALIIISLSWFFHRPWLGGGLLFAALSPFFYLARSFIHYHRI